MAVIEVEVWCEEIDELLERYRQDLLRPTTLPSHAHVMSTPSEASIPCKFCSIGSTYGTRRKYKSSLTSNKKKSSPEEIKEVPAAVPQARHSFSRYTYGEPEPRSDR